MKSKPHLLICLIALSLLAACGGEPTESLQETVSESEPELAHIRLPMGYIPSVQYAPFYVAVDKGYFREAGIELEFDYSFETDGVTLVDANNEPIQLRAQGYRIDVIRVADYVRLASNGLISNEATITKNPQLVRRMV